MVWNNPDATELERKVLLQENECVVDTQAGMELQYTVIWQPAAGWSVLCIALDEMWASYKIYLTRSVDSFVRLIILFFGLF